MKVSVEKIEKNKVKMEIEVDAARFEEGMNFSYKKNAKKFVVQGFRKGKAPRKIVERYYGEGVLYEDAFEHVYNEVYDIAVKDNNLEPVDNPELDIVKIGNGENLVFTAEITVKPEFELGKYKGIEIEKKEIAVTDEDVDSELNKVAEKNSRLVAVEDRPVENDDTTDIDFTGYIDGETFDGGEGKNFELVIGSGQFIPGFEEQLIGCEKGAEVEVNVTFPEDYNVEEFAGKAALFKVVINEIKKKELPVVDDEFAKDVSEFESLEEYKKSIYEDLLKKKEEEDKNRIRNEVLEKISEDTEIDIPEPMIERRVNNILYDMDMNLRYQGMELKQYLDMMGQNIQDFGKTFRPRAEKDVKMSLIIEKIRSIEGIEATDEDFDAEVSKYVKNSDEAEKIQFVDSLSDDDKKTIKDDIAGRKTIDLIVSEIVMK